MGLGQRLNVGEVRVAMQVRSQDFWFGGKFRLKFGPTFFEVNFFSTCSGIFQFVKYNKINTCF